jgi:Cu(I)/Ag(I) efflux system protein CusF
MKKFFVIACAALAFGAAQFASAVDTLSAAEVAQGKGVVKKVDAAAGVVNISHEAIPAIKWPAMTMDIKVKDAKLVAGIKPGQQVSFGLVKDPAAGYVISRIEAAK